MKHTLLKSFPHLAPICFVTLFAIGGTALIHFISNLHKIDRHLAFERTIKTNADANKKVQDHFSNLQKDLEAYALRPTVKLPIIKNEFSFTSQTLKDIKNENPEIEILFISDLKGINLVMAPSDPTVLGKNYAFRQWFQAVSTQNQTIVSEVYRTAAFPRPQVVAVSTPVRDHEQKTIAYLTALVKVETISSWLKESPTPDIRISVFDQVGNLLSLSNAGFDEIENQRQHPVLQRSLAGRSGIFDGTDPASGKTSLISYSSIPQLKWNIITSQPKSEVYSQFILSLTTLLWSALLVIFAVLFITIWFKITTQSSKLGATHE